MHTQLDLDRFYSPGTSDLAKRLSTIIAQHSRLAGICYDQLASGQKKTGIEVMALRASACASIARMQAQLEQSVHYYLPAMRAKRDLILSVSQTELSTTSFTDQP